MALRRTTRRWIEAEGRRREEPGSSMTTDNLVPTTDQTLPVLYTLSVSIFGALAEPERPAPYLDGKLIVSVRNGDITIEHADPHIVIADKSLNKIDNGNAGPYVNLRPPPESAHSGLRTADTWAGWTLRVHGINRDLIYRIIGKHRLCPIAWEAAWPD